MEKITQRKIKKILEFIKTKKFCVLATADDKAKTEAAIVVFFPKNDFTILFFSDSRTRKIKNLRKNNQASIVIGDVKNNKEVQIDGEIIILKNDKSQKAKEFILTVAPYMRSHIEKRTNGVFFQFKPNWIRFCDFSKKPDEIYECKFLGL
jgi:uncharacterized protein YhbP (UPF0306 family)